MSEEQQNLRQRLAEYKKYVTLNRQKQALKPSTKLNKSTDKSKSTQKPTKSLGSRKENLVKKGKEDVVGKGLIGSSLKVELKESVLNTNESSEFKQDKLPVVDIVTSTPNLDAEKSFNECSDINAKDNHVVDMERESAKDNRHDMDSKGKSLKDTYKTLVPQNTAIFKNRTRLYGLKRIILGVGESIEVIRLPLLLFLSLEDAIEQAKKGNKQVSRFIFQLLSKTTLDPSQSYFYYYKKWKRVTKPWFDQAEFWITWARYEEDWGDLNQVADIYFDAIDQLTNRNDVVKLREEYYAFQTRVGMLKREIDVDDSVEPTLDSKSLDVEEMLHDVYVPNEPIWESENVHIEPVVKSENVVNDIVDMLGSLSIQPKPKPKPEFEMEIPFKHPKTPGKKVIGVPVNAKNGSSVTVLTPVKASRKAKHELGVEQVITPVRRSLRFFNQEDYTADGCEESIPTREKVVKLLENHGYAYVPNKVVLFD